MPPASRRPPAPSIFRAMPVPAAPPPRLVRTLRRLAREYPLERKLLVAPSFGAGRELLRRLALTGEGWVGLEVTTVRPLAQRMARASLEEEGLRTLDAFDLQALVDEALDGVLPRSGEDAGLHELAEGVGFREAVREAVEALRLAGVAPRTVARSAMRDRVKRRFMARVLERYEALLRERRGVDTAGVVRAALRVLDGDPEEARRHLGGTVVALMPGLGTRGLSGRVVQALRDLGAGVLETDPVRGFAPPGSILWAAPEQGGGTLSWLHVPDERPASVPSVDLSFFHAASVTDELREVLRRVAARGLAWDDVEIVTPDPAAYGSSLHALASELKVPVTYAVGLPVERTRPGRVVHAYLDWIAGGFQASPVRRLLEAGDLRPRSSLGFHAPADLARRFRSLRIGWGRMRYRRQIRDALAALDDLRAGRHETEERFDRRVARTRGELEALRSIFFPALKATPSVPDRLGEGGRPVSPSELARGLRAFLRRVPRGDGADRAARDRIHQVLERVEATLRRRTDFPAAVAILKGHLEMRVRAPEPAPRTPDDRGAPWGSEGGHLHLSDLEHGGYTGRPAVFLVGADADRIPGAGSQDPVLLDRDRFVLPGDLPTSSDLLRERSFRLAALLARVRGSLTLSFASWNAADGRTLQPSPLLLQTLRLLRRDGRVSFDELHRELDRVACALPGPGDVALDADDVWMGALEQDGLLRSGADAVRAAFPALDRGLAAEEARLGGVPGPHQGVLPARPELDPRENPEVVLSASRLEDLGTCPLRYLYGTVMRVRPPEELELDPDRWLDPLARGSILHEVYERTLRRARERGIKPHEKGLEEVALEVLAARLGRARAEIPSPGEGVVRRETAGLEEDVRSFVRMIREDGAPWVRLELGFGLAGEEPLEVEVDGGRIRMRGAVDRVDEDLHGLHVVDYKTGRPRDFQPKKGVFNGGRRLQHAVYAEAVDRLMEGAVVTGGYHYPTRRGQNGAFRFDRADLSGAPELVGRLLDGVAAGTFVPTDQEDDCTFCDFAPVCRARRKEWGGADSPLARWSGERGNTGVSVAFRHLRGVRDFEEDEG